MSIQQGGKTHREGPKEDDMLPRSPGDQVQKLRPPQQPGVLPNANPAAGRAFPAYVRASVPSFHTH